MKRKDVAEAVKQWRNADGFGKDEWYDVEKLIRIINASDDKVKVQLGPIIKAVEDVIYADPRFVKKTPVADRGKAILRDVVRDGCKIFCTDFKSLEASLHGDLKRAVEFRVYHHILKYTKVWKWFSEIMDLLLAGERRFVYKWFVMYILASRRASGEMDTSAGNSLVNLITLNFFAEERGSTDVRCKVEGDDGVSTMDGPFPTPEDYAKIGMLLESKIVSDVADASFCGLVFDQEDEIVICDPMKVLMRFGWASVQYLRARTSRLRSLLRAKALSLLHQYPQCPIVSALGHRFAYLTRSYDVRDVLDKTNDWWQRQILAAAVEYSRKPEARTYRQPPDRTRMLMQVHFGITVEHQIEIERYIWTAQIGPLCHPLIDLYIRPLWKWYACNFVYSSDEVPCFPCQNLERPWVWRKADDDGRWWLEMREQTCHVLSV